MGKTGERMQVCRKGIPLASVQVWKVCRVGTVCRNWNWNASQKKRGGGDSRCVCSPERPPVVRRCCRMCFKSGTFSSQGILRRKFKSAVTSDPKRCHGFCVCQCLGKRTGGDLQDLEAIDMGPWKRCEPVFPAASGEFTRGLMC